MTELGTRPLRDLCVFKHGGTPSKSNPSFWAGDIPWVSPKDMKQAVIDSATDYISAEAVAGSATSIVPSGSILAVVRSGILAHSFPIAQVAKPLAFNQDIKAVIPVSEDVDPHYLYWFLRSQSRNVITRGVKKGATVHSVQSGFIENLQVPMRPREDQRRIVDLLARAEGIVRLRREAQQKAAELIPAIYIDMFGDPATNPKRLSVVNLGQLLAESPTLGTMLKPSSTPGGWLDLRVANIQGGELTLSDKKWVDLEGGEIARFELRDGDLLLARAIGSLDHLGKAVVIEKPGKWAFDSHLMRVRCNRSALLPQFLKAFLESPGGRAEFLKHTRRSAVQFNINGKELRQLSLPLPPMAAQIVFADRVKAVKAIEGHQLAALRGAQSVFDALLSSAFY